MTRLRILIALAALATAQGSASADSLFFTENSTSLSNAIYRANTDGTGLQEIYSADPAAGGGIFSLAVDNRRQQLYWTERFSGLLRRSNFDGSGVETVVSGLSTLAEDIAIDSLRGHIYALRFDNSTLTNFITRYDLDGTNQTTILDGIFAADHIAVDEVNGTLYFSDSSDISGTLGTYRVRSASLDGTGVETLLSDLVTLDILEADPSVGFLYAGSSFGGEVYRMKLDGTGLQTFSEFFQGLAIDPSGVLYGTRGLTGSKIVRAGLDASGVTPIPGLENFDTYHIAFASSVAVVPEPSSLALAGLGALGLIAARRIARGRGPRA